MMAYPNLGNPLGYKNGLVLDKWDGHDIVLHLDEKKQ
jgi:hypothetical protein